MKLKTQKGGELPLLPAEMVKRMKKYIALPKLVDYYIVLLFALLARLRTLMPNDTCLYIVFIGPTGTGKTHAGMFTTEISNGKWHDSVTVAALRSGVCHGRVTGIDEVDAKLANLRLLEEVLRVGNRWGSIYTKTRQTPNGWVPEEIECGGPKVLTSTMMLERGLMSRSYVILMSKPENSQQLTVNWDYRADDMKAISRSLDLLAKLLKTKYKRSAVEALQKSPGHQRKLKAIARDHARRTDLANTLLTVEELLGWSVKGLVEAVGNETLDEDEGMLREVVLKLVSEERTKPLGCHSHAIKASEAVSLVNRKMKAAGLPQYRSCRHFWSALNETHSNACQKVRQGDGIYYILDGLLGKKPRRGDR